MDTTSKPSNRSIFHATEKCRKSLEKCLENQKLNQDGYADNCYSDFNRWTTGLGVSARRQISLDQRLASAPEARKIVTDLLSLLYEFTEQCIHDAEQEGYPHESSTPAIKEEDIHLELPDDPIPRSFSPWSDESDPIEEVPSPISKTKLQQSKDNVKDILSQLISLGFAIRRAGDTSRLARADNFFNPNDYNDFYKYLVMILLRRKFEIDGGGFSYYELSSLEIKLKFRGAADHQWDPIQKHMMNTNIRRRHRFIYAQARSKKLAQASKEVYDDFPERQEAVFTMLMPSLSRNPDARPIPALDSHIPSTTNPSLLDDEAFKTMGHNSRRIIPASTKLSVTASKLTYPKPPAINQEEMSFTCPCCCQLLPQDLSSKNHWVKHLAEDLRPYACPFEDCPQHTVFYSTRELWIEHLRNAHPGPKQWKCFACQIDESFPTEAALTAHLKAQHGTTISGSVIQSVVKDWGQASLPYFDACPICLEGDPDQEKLVDHIVEHMHEFSLLALPWAATIPWATSIPGAVAMPEPNIPKIAKTPRTGLSSSVVRWLGDEDDQPTAEAMDRTIREIHDWFSNNVIDKTDSIDADYFDENHPYFGDDFSSQETDRPARARGEDSSIDTMDLLPEEETEDENPGQTGSQDDSREPSNPQEEYSYRSQTPPPRPRNPPPPSQNPPPRLQESPPPKKTNASSPELSSLFQTINKSGTGSLTESELSDALVNEDWSLFDPKLSRMLIQMFATKNRGSLEFDEFAGLWGFLQSWRDLFRRFDEDESGRISLPEFIKALKAFGYRLSEEFVSRMYDMFNNGRGDGENGMSFDMFVQTCIHLKRLTDMFKKYDDDRDGYVTFSFEDFLSELLVAGEYF